MSKLLNIYDEIMKKDYYNIILYRQFTEDIGYILDDEEYYIIKISTKKIFGPYFSEDDVLNKIKEGNL